MWPRGIVVVTPSIPQRRATRDVTLVQWVRLGADPIMIEQDPALPLGPHSQLATARAALRAGLGTGAEMILYAEDDIDIDPHIADILPCCTGDAPVSFWHRPRFRPRDLQPHPGCVIIAPAVGQSRWWGGPCIAMTPAHATRLCEADVPKGGIDLALRVTGVRITIPAMVEHRSGPRYASRGGHVTSDTYRGPHGC